MFEYLYVEEWTESLRVQVEKDVATDSMFTEQSSGYCSVLDSLMNSPLS